MASVTSDTGCSLNADRTGGGGAGGTRGTGGGVMGGRCGSGVISSVGNVSK
jgi:hypothetical protein